jgi:hypothetical protein
MSIEEAKRLVGSTVYISGVLSKFCSHNDAVMLKQVTKGGRAIIIVSGREISVPPSELKSKI